MFRPKTRSIIRRNEAAAAAAFFSSMDVISTTPSNPNDKVEAASAAIMKEVMQYRLSKNIKWYHIVIGALQDVQVTKAAVAHIYWDYKPKNVLESLATKITSLEGEPAQEVETEYPEQGNLPSGAFTMGGEEVRAQPAAEVEQVSVKQEKPLQDKPCITLIPVENIRLDPGADWTDPINTSPYIIHLMPMYAMDVRE